MAKSLEKSEKENRYKFERVYLNVRWVDYVKIRQAFPAYRNESVASYFMRLALWSQEQAKRK